MDELKARILQDGKALSTEVLLVDSFLNHRMDVPLMRAIGGDFAHTFSGKGATLVATIESSGIAPAIFTGQLLNVPVLVFKKSASKTLSDDLIQTTVKSFTKGNEYQLTTKREFLRPGESVLFIDDFLATGESALGVAQLIKQAGAEVLGMGFVIEKAFQGGRARLQAAGFRPYSQAVIARMDKGVIEFADYC